uniref:N-acetyltransferase ESCO acetyl-transferase domain-containing protein n=1 Tax=Setaria digitata TaxID=48799 RepID=A0A915PVR8_9BILA
MSNLRQKLLTDFYRLPERNTISVINCKSIPVIDLNCENENFHDSLQSAENHSLSQSSGTASTSKIIRTIIESDKVTKKKRRMLLDDPKQMILDAGQKQFGHQHCDKCGMVYDSDSLIDRKQHQKYHSRFVSTEWFRVQTAQLNIWKRSAFCIVEQFQGTYSYIFCITQISKCTLKARVDKVILECVNKELGYTPDLGQVWTSDGRRQAWVFITASDTYYFIGAIALVEKVSKKQLYYAEENSKNTDVLSRTNNIYMGVNRIWVHQCLRRKGIAVLLLDHVRSHFISSDLITRDRIAFSSLTDSGLAFAKNYACGGKVLLYSLNSDFCH